MNIQKYNPFNWFKDEEAQHSDMLTTKRHHASHPFLQLHQEIDRLFDDAFRNFGVPSLGSVNDAFKKSSLLKPNVNISESDKEYSITVEVPGVDEDDIKLELTNGILTISGEKKAENEENDKSFTRVERSYGSFKRVLSLPEDVNEDDIDAEFQKGVLTLTLPRKTLPKSSVKRIDIRKG